MSSLHSVVFPVPEGAEMMYSMPFRPAVDWAGLEEIGAALEVAVFILRSGPVL